MSRLLGPNPKPSTPNTGTWERVVSKSANSTMCIWLARLTADFRAHVDLAAGAARMGKHTRIVLEPVAPAEETCYAGKGAISRTREIPMEPIGSVADLCASQGLDSKQLAAKAGLEERRVQAIADGRWTPSPAERDRI